MTKKISVLHITNDYPNTQVYKQLHRALDAVEDISPTFFVPMECDRHTEEAEGVVYAPCFQKNDRFFYFRKQRKIYHELRKLLAEKNADVLQAHFIFSAGYACLKAKQEFHVPYIVTVRNTDINLFFKRCFWLRRTGLSILRNASYIVFLCEAYQDALLNTYVPRKWRESIRKKCVLMRNGVDAFWLTNAAAPHKLRDSKHINLIFAGSINKNKNCVTTARACELLLQKGYSPHYTVVGNVEDREVYEDLMRFPFVEYIPRLSKEELAEVYLKQDIFVMPSIHETFGLVYVEAMSQGLPICYTKGQGFDRQFPEGTVGFHVDANDPSTICEAIMHIIRQYETISNNCCTLSKEFEWDCIANQYRKIYLDLIERETENGGTIMSLYKAIVSRNKEKWKKIRIIKRTYFGILRFLFSLDPVIPLRNTLRLYFYVSTGRWIDYNNPRDFNEKIQWLKAFYRDKRYIQCADKYSVREYVKACGLERILNELYAVYNSANEIKLEDLPDRFAMKCVHGCGSNLICSDKTKLDESAIKEQFSRYMRKRIGNISGEKHYNEIQPRIIVEKNLMDENGRLPLDYKVFCFNGKPHCICIFADRGFVEHGTTRCYFDFSWNMLDYCTDTYKTDQSRFPRPSCLSDIYRIAEALCKPFPFVRVDLYVVKDQIIFGELTFTPAGGKGYAYNAACQNVFYECLKLPDNRDTRTWHQVARQDT